MRVVVVGDVGRAAFYHTGDEAMTDAAIDLLRERGVEDIVLVASSPEVATRTYGLPAVPRFRFSKTWTRRRCDRRLAALSAMLERGELPEGDRRAVIEAVAGADVVLIAGGGNLRSEHRYMIYERLAIVRVARHYGTPVFVTSQTVGPMLDEADESLVKEIADAATLFGAREPDTVALVRDLVEDPSTVVQTVDDSVLLEPRESDVRRVEALGLPTRYLVASFTYHPGHTGLSQPEYQALVAALLDDVAARLDAEVLLLPHCGSFEPDQVSLDRANDQGILAASTSGRLRALPMLTAREAIAVTRGAVASISTRYHATVFGTSRAVPSIGLVTSYYSSVRMAGALGNAGVPQFAIPLSDWTAPVVAEAVDEIAALDVDLRRHLGHVHQLRRAEQAAWWDALVAAMRGEPVTTSSHSETPAFASGPWRQRVADALAFANPYWTRTTELRRAQAELSAALAAAPGPRDPMARGLRRLRRVGGRLRRAVRL